MGRVATYIQDEDARCTTSLDGARRLSELASHHSFGKESRSQWVVSGTVINNGTVAIGVRSTARHEKRVATEAGNWQ